MNKFAIVDLETTGNSANKGDRIIEIAIIIYQEGQIIDQYNQLINPEQHISRFISYLTGITNEMVTEQPVFAEVASEIYSFFDQVYFVAHNVPFDLGFLNYELKRAGLSPIVQPVIDTVELSRILLPQAPSFKLAHLSEWLDLKHDAPHRALSDAYVTTKLLDYLRHKLNTLPLTTMEQLIHLEPDLKSNLNSILTSQKEKTKEHPDLNENFAYAYQLAYKPIEREERVKEKTINSFGDFLDQLFSEDTLLKKTFPTFEDRPGQREMSEYIYHAFQSNQHAIIEAGTGTGKTLAYLIAACYHAIHHDEKVIISTYLIQLQKQLLNQDWVRLKQALPFECQVAVLKGKQHYLNLALFSQALHDQSQNYDQVLTKAILTVWLTETNTGDVDEVQLPSSGYRFFKRVSANNEHQVSSKQSDQENTYYQTAKQRAEQADLLIINHSLLADSMLKEEGLIKKNDKMIIDEAHHLEQVVADRFGLQLDYLSCHKKLKTVRQFIEQLSLANNEIKEKLQQFITFSLEENDLFYRYIYHLVDKRRDRAVSKNDLGRYQHMIESEDQSEWLIVIEMAERLQFTFHDLINLLGQITLEDYDQTRKSYFIQELNEIKWALKKYFNHDSIDGKVNWIEIEHLGAQNAVYLYQQPINTAQYLKEYLFDRLNSVVLTSASLTVSGQFEFFKGQIGMNDQDMIERSIPSPYVFQDQVKLLIPNDFPIARYDDLDPFIEATCEAIFTLADVTNGRMLILFNSYDLLRKAYYLLRELFNDEYVLIAQGISSGSHERLKKNFQSFNRSILLGTNAFWEGLDIPGSDLSCVVMVRLPFDSPNHPVIKQKHDLMIRQGQNPFLSLSLPNAVIRFKQGFGRLIRSQKDRGIILVCDDRLMTKSYGQAFIDSIPNVPVFHRRTNELLEIASNWL